MIDLGAATFHLAAIAMLAPAMVASMLLKMPNGMAGDGASTGPHGPLRANRPKVFPFAPLPTWNPGDGMIGGATGFTYADWWHYAQDFVAGVKAWGRALPRTPEEIEAFFIVLRDTARDRLVEFLTIRPNAFPLHDPARDGALYASLFVLRVVVDDSPHSIVGRIVATITPREVGAWDIRVDAQWSAPQGPDSRAFLMVGGATQYADAYVIPKFRDRLTALENTPLKELTRAESVQLMRDMQTEAGRMLDGWTQDSPDPRRGTPYYIGHGCDVLVFADDGTPEWAQRAEYAT